MVLCPVCIGWVGVYRCHLCVGVLLYHGCVSAWYVAICMYVCTFPYAVSSCHLIHGSRCVPFWGIVFGFRHIFTPLKVMTFK